MRVVRKIRGTGCRPPVRNLVTALAQRRESSEAFAAKAVMLWTAGRSSHHLVVSSSLTREAGSSAVPAHIGSLRSLSKPQYSFIVLHRPIAAQAAPAHTVGESGSSIGLVRLGHAVHAWQSRVRLAAEARVMH